MIRRPGVFTLPWEHRQRVGVPVTRIEMVDASRVVDRLRQYLAHILFLGWRYALPVGTLHVLLQLVRGRCCAFLGLLFFSIFLCESAVVLGRVNEAVVVHHEILDLSFCYRSFPPHASIACGFNSSGLPFVFTLLT